MSVRFGTDGVRGLANDFLTAEMALAIGRACAVVFPAGRVVIGCDTRRSSPMLEAATVAGVLSAGCDAVVLGVVPTPAVAFGADRDGVAGMMISASHNPFADNGIKIFAPGGRKLSGAEQTDVESAINELIDEPGHRGPTGTGIGTRREDPTVVDAYVASVVASIRGRSLDGLTVVVDCANGSNSELGPEVLARLGARVIAIGTEPDGVNINAGCGSTHPELLQSAVLQHGADVGIAFDGDADRLVAVDHTGALVDGDQIIALCAVDLHERGLLASDTVVVTVMSNLGFRQEMQRRGINVVETAVGDRHVLEALADGGYSLGGEQSGHIVFSDSSTTGDGLLSAVTLLDLLRRSDATLAAMTAASMVRLPQVLLNVAARSPMPDVADRLADEIAAIEAELGDAGRVLLRPSGTEPVVRVMAEAPSFEGAQDVAERLAAAVEALAGQRS